MILDALALTARDLVVGFVLAYIVFATSFVVYWARLKRPERELAERGRR